MKHGETRRTSSPPINVDHIEPDHHQSLWTQSLILPSNIPVANDDHDDDEDDDDGL